MHGEPLRVGSFAKRFKLCLEPHQHLCKQYRGLFCKRTVLLMQFCAQGSNGAAAPRENLPVVECHLDEGAEPFPGRIQPIQRPVEHLYLRQTLVYNRRTDLLFGFKVVIDISRRHIRLRCNVGQPRLPESVSVYEGHGGLD